MLCGKTLLTDDNALKLFTLDETADDDGGQCFRDLARRLGVKHFRCADGLQGPRPAPLHLPHRRENPAPTLESLFGAPCCPFPVSKRDERDLEIVNSLMNPRIAQRSKLDDALG